MIGLSGNSVVDKLIFAVAVSAQGLLVNAAYCSPDNLLQRISVIDEDGRMTEEKYARAKNLPLAEIQRRFAATGQLKFENHRADAHHRGACFCES